MIAIYNQYMRDVLMLIIKDDQGQARDFERRGDIARVFLAESGETVAWNIFNASQHVTISGNGQVTLSDSDVELLNDMLAKEGFTESLVNDASPKFVVGEIVEMVAHPDSDHLNITQVNIGDGKTVQIVAGAPNARVGLKTIVALPGAMMPNGALIFEGALRGVDSYGMMTSPRELQLPNAPQVRGIIELDEAEVPGTPFDPAKHWTV
jgi:tRNA-binding protein